MKTIWALAMVLVCGVVQARTGLRSGQPGVEFHVDPAKGDASSNARGSADNPFKTIQQAQNAVKAVNRNMGGDIIVYLHGGTYSLNAPLAFSAHDGGYNGFHVVYKAFQNEKPVVSGGKPITGWQAVKGKGYFVAKVPVSAGYPALMRNIFVNGRRALQASGPFITPHIMTYDNPKTPQPRDGLYVKTSDLKKYTHLNDISFFQCGAFKHIEIPLAAILPVTPTESVIMMKQPNFYNWTNTYTYYCIPDPEPIRLVNAFEELDEPGEFYHDRSAGLVYYFPRKDENLKTAETMAPAVETLLKVVGSANAFVHNLSFEGIAFQYGNWTTWATKEIGRSQADLYADYTAIEGLINLQYTDHLTFNGCRFEHLLGSGIYLPDNNNNTVIQGNVFNDLTAAAVLVGKDMTASPIVNNHVLIDNNVVRSVGADYFQSSGIYANISNNLTITHNDVADVAYFGINQRYHDLTSPFAGNTQISYNKVSNYGTASKYGFGITDEVGAYYFYHVKNSVFSNNYGEYLGNKNLDGCFREDGGGLNNRFVNNVANCKASKKSFSFGGDPNANLLFDNNYSNVPDKFTGIPGCTVTNFHLEEGAPFTKGWSAAAQAIIDSAGLEKPYRHLLDGFGKDVYDTAKAPAIRNVDWSGELLAYIQKGNPPVPSDLNQFWTTFGNANNLSKQGSSVLIKNIGQSAKAVFRGGYYDNAPIRFRALFKDSIKTQKEVSFRVPTFSYKALPRYYFVFTENAISLKRLGKDMNTVTLIGYKGKISEAVKYRSSLYTTGSDIEILANNEPGGVRITLTIDGTKWVDCLDSLPGYLTNPGLLMFDLRGEGGSILLSNPKGE